MALDKHAPERTKEITISSTNPWFTNKVKTKRKQLEEERKYGENKVSRTLESTSSGKERI